MTHSAFHRLDPTPEQYSEVYNVHWWRPLPDKQSLGESISLHGGTTILFRMQEDDPAVVFVDDPRLGKPPYKNVEIYRTNQEGERFWAYQLFIDLRDQLSYHQYNQYINLTGGFVYENPADSIYRPEPPSEEEIVTTLLNLTEPLAIDIKLGSEPSDKP